MQRPDEIPAVPSRTPIVVSWLPTLLLVPTLLALFLTQDSAWDRWALQVACVVVLLASAVVVVLSMMLGRRRVAMPPMAVLGIVAASVWLWCYVNSGFVDWAQAARAGDGPGSRDLITRKTVLNYHWPNYGTVTSPATWLRTLAVIAGTVTGAVLVWLAVHARRPFMVAALASLAMAASAAGVALGDRPDRWSGGMSVQVWNDLYVGVTGTNDVNGIPTLFREFHAYQRGDLDHRIGRLRQSHYPIGPILLYGPMGVVPGKVLVFLLACGSPMLLFFGIRAWGGSCRVASLSAAVLAVDTELVLQASLYVGSLLLPAACGGIWLCGIALGLGQTTSVRRRMAGALGLGVLVWATVLFTFGIGFWTIATGLAGLCMGLLGRTTASRLSITALLALIGLVSFTLLTWLLTGYNGYDALHTARGGHHSGVIPPIWRVGESLYYYKSVGNAIGFWSGHAVVLAFAVLGLLTVAVRRGPSTPVADDAGPLALAAVAVLAIPALAFSGNFALETERVWLFLAPALAAGGGWWLSRIEQQSTSKGVGMALLTSAAVTVVTSLVYRNTLG